MIDLHHGDCLRMAEWIEPASVNLVVTSPPYAMMRASQYGGIEPSVYPKWWMKVMDAVDHVLATGGSVVVNWQGGRDGLGKRLLWDIRTINEVWESGRWALRDIYCWDKGNPMPGAYKNAFTSGWEQIIHWTRCGEEPCWNPHDVKVNRVRMNTQQVQENDAPGRKATNREELNRRSNSDKASTSNVLRFGVGGIRSGDHPAIFPERLPRFFIRLLSNPGDVVLDPFAGSGTTMHVALEEGRRSIGVEKHDEYFAFLEKRFDKVQTTLLSEC